MTRRPFRGKPRRTRVVGDPVPDLRDPQEITGHEEAQILRDEPEPFLALPQAPRDLLEELALAHAMAADEEDGIPRQDCVDHVLDDLLACFQLRNDHGAVPPSAGRSNRIVTDGRSKRV
jgi:hypothetical protein